MRAKQSSTADGSYGDFAISGHTASDVFNQDAGLGEQDQAGPRRPGNGLHSQGTQRAGRSAQAMSADLRGEGLLHDARNLVSAIGLYCDLLSMPGVLKPEHRQYPQELRLLGTRSRVLIEHLMRSLVSQSLSDPDCGPNERLAERTSPKSCALDSSALDSSARANRRIQGALPDSRTPHSAARATPVSLRTIVERCSGLLSRVANDRPIEVIYGTASDVPLSVSEEAVERILVNLVRNASQALDRQVDHEPLASPADGDPHTPLPALRSSDLRLRHHRRPASSSLAGSRAAIRISVGPLLDRIGEARSWPFQHVRLVVEDSGCGMSSAQLHALLCGQMTASRATHGIGFRVVREMVAASNGDLRAASTPGIGTRVQIEWPVAATPTTEKDGALMQRNHSLGSALKSPVIDRQHRPMRAASQPSTMIEGRPGVN